MTEKYMHETSIETLSMKEVIHGLYTGIKVDAKESFIGLMDVSVKGENKTIVRDLPNKLTFVRIGIKNSEIVLGNVIIPDSVFLELSAGIDELFQRQMVVFSSTRIVVSETKEELFRIVQDQRLPGKMLSYSIHHVDIPEEYRRQIGDSVVLRDDGSVLAFEQASKGKIVH